VTTRLRIAVLHNRYVEANPSGENVVVDQEIALLRDAGHEVFPYLRSSDEIGDWSLPKRAALPISPIWSRQATREVGRLLDEHRPDVVHLHNPYPLLSPAVVTTATRRGVPVVQTLHNYRHACMKGTLFRDGEPCEDCVGRVVQYPGVLHGCYRGSRPQSLVMGASAALSRGTWRHDVSRYFVLTEFMADRLRRHGLPAAAMVVRPQAVADPGPPAPPGRGAVFVGRLDIEKGIDLLVDAWRRARPPARHAELTVVGDGPLRAVVEGVPGVRWLGRLDRAAVADAVRAAALAVIPSRVYEGMPVAAVEALAAARPLLVTEGGALGEVAGAAGWSVAARPDAMAAMLERALSDDAELARRSRLARALFTARHTESSLVALLERTYRDVMRPRAA
jgi:glycosyltransferase involved in cell wall biosynthesis